MASALFTFNSKGELLDPVDGYSSLIWTERFIEMGDFRLVFPYIPSILDKFKTGMWLRLDQSQEVMRIEQIDLIEPKEGQAGSITYTGRSLTSFLENRMVRATSYYSNGLSMMYSIANPIKWMNDLVRMACTVVTYSSANPYVMNWQGANSHGVYPWVIPNLQIWTNEYETGGESEILMQPGYLLDRLLDYARAYSIGFRLYYPFSADHPYFETWYGPNNTKTAPFNKRLYTSELGNLKDVRESRSIRTFKNKAHGWPQNGSSGMTDELHYVRYHDADENTFGWDLYELMYVTPDDLALNAGRNLGTINAVMQQRLATELNNNPYSVMVDGTIVLPAGENIHSLRQGAFVTVGTKSGTEKDVRVTEIITSIDAESGELNYANFSG